MPKYHIEENITEQIVLFCSVHVPNTMTVATRCQLHCSLEVITTGWLWTFSSSNNKENTSYKPEGYYFQSQISVKENFII